MIKNFVLSLVALSLSSTFVFAEEKELPSSELEFIKVINDYEQSEIVNQLGEPARKKDIYGKTGEVEASIWHYTYINTTPEGEYYKVTELDFIKGKVVNVIFINQELSAEDE